MQAQVAGPSCDPCTHALTAEAIGAAPTPGLAAPPLACTPFPCHRSAQLPPPAQTPAHRYSERKEVEAKGRLLSQAEKEAEKRKAEAAAAAAAAAEAAAE